MAKPIVVEFDVLKDVSRGKDKAVSTLEEAIEQAFLAISAVTEVKLYGDFHSPGEVTALKRFLKHFRVLPLTSRITHSAIDLLQEHRGDGLKLGDMLIAATAINHEMRLLTGREEFRTIEKLEVLSYSNPSI